MTAGGGIGGTGIISSGTISAFGSIVVNGTEFDTSNAAIIVNGKERSVDDLDIGLKTFEINDLTVNYALLDSDDLPQGFADGLLVEVEGIV